MHQVWFQFAELHPIFLKDIEKVMGAVRNRRHMEASCGISVEEDIDLAG